MMIEDIADKLREFASRTRRLPKPYDHRQPEAFHEAKSELARDIEQLASDLNCRRPARPRPER